MPLVAATLQGELVDIYEKGKQGNPTPALVGIKTGKAYMNYCSAAMNAGSGSFTAMPGASTLGSDLGEIFGSPNPSGQITGTKMAKAFDTCLATFLSVYQNSIITAAGLGALNSELMDLFSSPKQSGTMFAQGLAKALNNYTLAATVIGIIPGSPPVPFTGPLS
tara:strand:+ start:162 stop:653 length:492 start_codon:yes stop_codon:yes gene_type:complete